MPVSALTPRTNRLTGPGRGSGTRRSAADPALTVTVAIPLTEALGPQAHRLIEAVRELVEISQGTITVEPVLTGGEEPDELPSGPEVRMLTDSRQVLLDGEPLPLTRLEFDLLLFLAERPRRVFTRGQLLAGVWGYEHTGERTVDVHVRRLRLKLGSNLPVITTVYGVGYRLSDDSHVVVQAHE
jgi:DNA-binding response OmpR family regulator